MNNEKKYFEIVLSARGLCKTYPDTQNNGVIKALDHLDLDVREGEILGILGPNGAGKTTFLNTLATLLLPDAGTIEIFGLPSVPKNFNAVRSWINMSSGYPNYAFSLTVEENLKFYGRLYGLSGQALQQKTDEVIELFNLQAYARRRFDELSSGTKQRLSLAKSLINDPKILFLDEPTIGLDPDVSLKTREVVLDILRRRRMTVLLTSHNMDEVESMCARVAFIQHGHIIKLAAVDELKRLHHTDDLEKIFIQLAHQANEEIVDRHSQPGLRQPEGAHCHPEGDRCHPERSEGSLKELPIPPTGGLKSWLNRALAFTMRSAIFSRRNLFVMTDVFFWPMISLISIGLMAKFVNLGSQTLGFVMTGTLAAGVLQIAQLDVGYTVLYELWSKSLKHTLLTPVGVAEGVVGTWAIGMLRGFIAFVILASAASWGFGFHLPGLVTTVLFLFGLFACALILGIMVNILILSFGQKVEITAWMFAQLFMILCGMYYPVDVLPRFFQYLALMVPITHFLEYFRQSYGFHAHTPYPLLTGFALTFLYIILALRFLAHAYTRARQKGIVIRFYRGSTTRLIHPIAGITILLSSIFLPTMAHADIWSVLVGWWKFDEQSSGTCPTTTSYVVDSSHSGSGPGTCFNSPTYVQGRVGQGALSFNGSNQYVSSTNGPNFFSGAPFTMSAWVLMNSVSGYQIIVQNVGGGGYNCLFGVKIGSNNAAGFNLYLAGTPNIQTVNTTAPISNVWYHVVGTYDGAYARIYVNGVLQSTSSSGTSTGYSGGIYIARPQGSNNYWNGSIDDVRIYNRALSASDVAMLYQYGTVIFNNATLRNLKTY